MLKLHCLKGPYSKENIIEAIIAIIKTYKIINKIGYFVLDNTRSNDTCVSTIIEQLKDRRAHV